MLVPSATQTRPRLLDKKTLIQQHPFFRAMEPRLVDRILAHAIVQKLKSGSVLFRKGDPGTRIYAILSGLVRIGSESSSGRDAVFSVLQEGEIFGEIAVLDGGPRSAGAIAISSCELMVIERRDFLPLLQEFPVLGIRFIEILCARLRHTTEQVEDIVFLDLENRLAKVLLHLHARAPAGSPQKTIRITQRALSHMVGASRESTNKQLRKWERSKLLKMQRGGMILLAPAALDRLVSEL